MGSTALSVESADRKSSEPREQRSTKRSNGSAEGSAEKNASALGQIQEAVMEHDDEQSDHRAEAGAKNHKRDLAVSLRSGDMLVDDS